MDNNSPLKHSTFNFKDILPDEIALDGLEGIGLDLLWRRLEKRVSFPITQKMRIRLWGFIVNNESISFYQVPEPLKRLEIIDRFHVINPETGQLLDSLDYIDGPYEYHPVKEDYGSSIHYNTRKSISRDSLKKVSYEKIVEEYGDTLVMVASIEERWNALAPHMPISELKQLTAVHYCILELVGRARENGQMTVGKTNLLKIFNDSKLLFYNRKYLQEVDLLRAQPVAIVVNNKTVKSLLLRLKRFHTPSALNMPKVGKIYNMLQHMSKQPDLTDFSDTLIKKGIFTQSELKKLGKTGLLNFETRVIFNQDKKKKISKRFVSLNLVSDESCQSDEETSEEPVKCKYRIKMNLLRQAYKLILESGLKGHTTVEIAQLLGVEFYMARMIFRLFKKKNIVREFFVDKGKVRVARYIATSVAAQKNNSTYEVEKKKFMEYFNASKTAKKTKRNTVSETTESDTDVPRKKIKLENESTVVPDNRMFFDHPTEEGITEIKLLDELKQIKSKIFSGKNATLRQLKYANGIIKIIKKVQVISGLQALNLLVTKEIDEPPMDLKCLKMFLHTLSTQGQIKVLKMEWPGTPDKYSVVFCAPEVQITDPKIKAKYKELYIKALKNKEVKFVKSAQDSTKRPLSLYSYNRYTKMQKMHEFLMKIVYFSDEETYHSTLPRGFSSLADIIPEFTVRFAIGISTRGTLAKIPPTKVPLSMFHMKLKDAPTDVFCMLLTSSSLESQCTANIRLLALLGLVQLIDEPSTDEFRSQIGHMFYINRRAKIIDTTGVWPREVVDKKALEKSYYFEAYRDVEQYWNDVYNISINTTVNVEPETRFRKATPKFLKPKEEVTANDNGQAIGNGLGPCGFDSAFFLDIRRLWSEPNESLLGIKATATALTDKRPKLVKKKKKKMPTVKPGIEKKPLTKSKKTKPRKIKFSKEEDKLIMICKAAITVFCPVAQPGSLTLRNLVAKDIITIFEPRNHVNFIHRRAEVLDSDPTLTYEQECLVNEIKHRAHIMKKYEGQYKVLKQKHSENLTKATAAARVPFMELVWIMLQIFNSESFHRKVPCVAKNIEEFQNSFTVCPSNANKIYNWYRTPPESNPVLATVKEGIMFSLVASYKREMCRDIASSIHYMFNTCPESIMRPAIEELRKGGAVAARDKKIALTETHKYHYHTAFNSSYKLSKKYQRQWVNRLSSEFFENLTDILCKKMPQSGLKGSPEMNCALLELNACGVVEIVNETIPVVSSSSNDLQEEHATVGDIMMNCHLKSGTMGWRNKSNVKVFSDLYKDLDCTNAFNDLIGNAKLKKPESNAEGDQKIVSHLKEKKESGATFTELQVITDYSAETLKSKLTELESSNITKPLGYFENISVLTKYAKPWTLPLPEDRVIPIPWLTLGMEINVEIFIKWAGRIVDKIFKYPGCSIAYLSESCEFISTRAVQEVCTILEKFKCVRLANIILSEPDLFSEDNCVPELTDFNPYASVESILVFPVKDTISRFAYVRNKLSGNEIFTDNYDVESDEA